MRALFQTLAFLPLPFVHGLGNVIGWLLWLIPNKRQRTARVNISLCLPELSAAQQRRLLRRSLCHEMKTMAEFAVLWYGGGKRVLGLLKEIRGNRLIDEALARGNGILYLTPHLGSWELPAMEYSARLPITGLYKPQKGALEAMALEGRGRFGAKLLPTIGGSVTRESIPLLAANEAVYFMPDQDPPEGRGEFAPFFGVSAHSPTLVSRLAQQTGAAVLFVYGERLSWGRGYIAHYHLASDEVYSPDIQTSVAAVNKGVETCVREFPEQYWWGYARFRRRPPGEVSVYN